MKPISRFIKGILLGLIVTVILSFGMPFLSSSNSPLAVKHAFAIDRCDPVDENGEFREVPDDCGQSAPGDGGAEGEDSGGESSYKTLLGNINPPEEAPDVSLETSEFVSKIASAANKSHRIFAPLINVFAFHIGNFLGTDYIYQGSMGKMLQKIWVISRNLVNISFVFILLWLALNTIFNPTFPLDDLKKKLIIFTLLLVGVNFSWLGTKVVLDAANVVTHAVFAIPSGISEPPSSPCEINGPEDPIKGACYPTAIFAPVDTGLSRPLIFEDKEGDDDNCSKLKESYNDAYMREGGNELGKRNPNPEDDENKKYWGRTAMCMENLNFINYNQNTAVIYLTYGMARIQNLVTTSPSQGIDDLAVSILLSLVIQLAYALSLLALFIALIIRMSMLWLFVGFSPFLVLVIWFKGAEGFAVGEMELGIKEFANWAFVPAKVGAIFAVSFIMISAGQAAGDTGIRLVDNLNIKEGFVFEIPEINTLFVGIGSLYQFIWLLMSLVVLWMGVFGVLGKMSIIKIVTSKINTFGTETFQKVATLPYKAPILPLGKGGKSTSFREQLSLMDPRNIIDKYTGDQTPEDVKTINRNAKSGKAASAVEAAAGLGNTLTSAEAHSMAKAFGVDLASFAAAELKVRVAAIMRAGKSINLSKEDATEIAEAMVKHSSDKANSTTAVKSKQQANLEAERIANAQIKAQQEKGLNQAPGGTAAAQPATAPKPPAAGPPAPKPPAAGPPAGRTP